MSARVSVSFAIDDDCEAAKIRQLLEALGYDASRVGGGGEVSGVDVEQHVKLGWRGVSQLARAWGLAEVEITDAIARLGVGESRAHALQANPPIYSPALQRLVEVELCGRGVLGPASAEERDA